MVKRGLVTKTVKATEIVKEHQTYCDTEREIKHFPAEILAYVTPVSGLILLFSVHVGINRRFMQHNNSLASNAPYMLVRWE